MHLRCEAGPLDEVGTGLGSVEAAVRAHGRREVAAKDPEEICCFWKKFQAAFEYYFFNDSQWL